MSANSRFQRILFMASLIVAGEAIFALPFHVTRFFRPTLLEVFGFTNTQLGAAQAVYGITAMLSYFPGGPLADRFSARRLLAASLLLTGFGGLYYLTIPGVAGMGWLFGFYGITTILLFWAAMIRATREWGGPEAQGRAYGILDGGRGLFAAVLATAAVVLLQVVMPDDPTSATAAERLAGLRAIILTYVVATLGAAVLVWLFVRDGAPSGEVDRAPIWRDVTGVLRLPVVWLHATIVVCAYVSYKGFDNYSLFAVDAWGLNEVEAARVSAIGAWARPLAALAAGFIGDRVTSSRLIAWGFALLTASHLVFGLATPRPSMLWVLFGNVVVACVAMFGIRGIYFALFEEGRVPMAVTGMAAGLVSVIGFTPDVFVALVAGVLIDRTPGAVGHQQFFLFLAAFAAIGFAATACFRRVVDSYPVDPMDTYRERTAG